MAKQAGPLFITGTIDGIIFYKLDGQYLMRAKGSYKSGKQMRKDPRLKRTLQNADRFGVASRIVKYTYYRHLPRAVRKHGLFGALTGMVNTWLYQGQSGEEAEALLIAYCKRLGQKAASSEIKVDSVPAVTTIINTTSTPHSINTPKGKLIKKPAYRVKQARYLSHWKVKHNGRLHIPKTVTVSQLEPESGTIT